MEAHAELPGKIQLLKKLYFNLEVLLAGDKEKKWKKKKLSGLLNSVTNKI